VLAKSGGPTALFAAGNRLTEGALFGLRDLGLKRGSDVELVGFDFRYAGFLVPPMPVMMQHAKELGQYAAEVLLDLIVGKPQSKIRPVPIELVLPDEAPQAVRLL